MNKNIFRIMFVLIAIFLLLFSAFTLVGCSDDSDDDSGCGCDGCGGGCDEDDEDVPDNSGNVGT